MTKPNARSVPQYFLLITLTLRCTWWNQLAIKLESLHFTFYNKLQQRREAGKRGKGEEITRRKRKKNLCPTPWPTSSVCLALIDGWCLYHLKRSPHSWSPLRSGFYLGRRTHPERPLISSQWPLISLKGFRPCFMQVEPLLTSKTEKQRNPLSCPGHSRLIRDSACKMPLSNWGMVH